MYSKELLLPSEILSDLPYKHTFDALEKNDEEAFYKLIRNSTVRIMMASCHRSFGIVSDKREKKWLLKGHIYLDCLITFFRLPTHIEESPEELSRRLKMPTNIIDHILNEFT